MSACKWPGNNETMRRYHDREWCVPSRDDVYLFEMLTLEGAQAGLSWSIVLAKREEYRKAFHQFDTGYCAELSDEELESIRENFSVIKNMSKIRSVRNNARLVLKLQEEFGSFADYLWRFVNDKPVVNSWETDGLMPARTLLSDRISLDMKKRGFKFVGSVTLYSFLQAIGMVDDHVRTCPFHTLNRTLQFGGE